MDSASSSSIIHVYRNLTPKVQTNGWRYPKVMGLGFKVVPALNMAIFGIWLLDFLGFSTPSLPNTL